VNNVSVANARAENNVSVANARTQW